MLSFDITDRNIRIIRGVESNGKIRINAAATLNLEEDVIVNGHVKDVPRLATLINQVLKTNKMADKEAVISLSSNLIIFKELQVPKAVKESELSKMVKTEMQTAMGIDDQYSISYVVVEDTLGNSEENTLNILATACPYEIIDCYKKVFQMLTISLKSVMVGYNSITKVLLSDAKLKAKMPLLAVQIDNTFISLSLYEKGQLSFARFATIDPADYDNSDDYVFEAVNENVFRMLQFQKSRNPQDPIGNVVFYGDTKEYVRLTNALEQMDIETSIINVPPQVHGYENLEFSLYANAIGAMFKRNKDTERINLLETDTVNNNRIKSNGSYGVLLAFVSIITAGIMILIVSGLFIVNGKYKSDIKEYTAKINSQDTKDKQAQLKMLEEVQTNVNTYKQGVAVAYSAYKTKPAISQDVVTKLDNAVAEATNELGLVSVVATNSYSNGVLTFDVVSLGTEDPSQKLPSLVAEKLKGVSDFANVAYLGYSISDSDQLLANEGASIKAITYSFTVNMQAGEIELPETTAVTTEETKDGAEE